MHLYSEQKSTQFNNGLTCRTGPTSQTRWDRWKEINLGPYVHLVCVDRSLFFVNTVGMLMAWASLLCWSVCICRGVDVGCLCLNTSCILTNSFPFRLPLVHTRVDGRKTLTNKLIDYHLNDQLMSSLLIFKCPMSHGTMKYTLKAHVCYFVLMVGLLHYLYSLLLTSINLQKKNLKNPVF
jgi:hypothetical protein